MRWFAQTLHRSYELFRQRPARPRRALEAWPRARRCRLEQLEPRTLLAQLVECDLCATANPAVNTLNEAPVLAAIEETALTYGENAAPTPITTAITTADADNTGLAGATIQITGNYQNGQDVLSFTDTTAIAATWSAATGTLTLAGTDTLANYQAALRAVKYQNTSECPSTAARTVTFSVTDGSADSNLLTRSITVIAVNDAPSGADASRTIAEDATYTFASTDFGFTDTLDNSANSLAAVKITTLPTAGTLTLDGAAVSAGQYVSVAQIDAGNLVFTPAANASGAAYADFTFQVQDDGGESGLVPFTVVVIPDTQSHVAQPGWFDTQVQWVCDNIPTENVAFVTHEGDVTNLNSTAEWEIAAEAMYRLDGRVPWGVIPGNHDGSQLFLEYFGPEHFAGEDWYGGAYLASSYQYFEAGGRTYLSLEIAYGASSDTFLWAQGVIDNNPGIPTIVTTHEYLTAGGSRTAAGTTLWNSLIKANNQIFMVLCGHLINQGNLAHNTVYNDAGSSVFEIIANYQDLSNYDQLWLRLMQFDEANSAIHVNTYSPLHSDDWEGIFGTTNLTKNQFDLTLDFDDRLGAIRDENRLNLDPTPNTFTVNVTSVNDAPQGTDTTVAVLEDHAYAFAAADFGFTDPLDSPANAFYAVKIGSLPAPGSLTLDGASVATGQMVATAAIDAGKLVFTPPANANASAYANFTFQVQDGGGTDNNGADLDPSANTLTIDVTAVNDAPSGSDATRTILEDGTCTFAPADFGFTDPSDSPANSLQAVKIATLPTAGSVRLNGTALSAGQVVTVADITSGNLTFTPAADACAAPYATFTFQVQDNGGTANDGANLDPSPNTFTLNVTLVNDAPSGTDAVRTIVEESTYTFAPSDFGFTDLLDSPANALLAVQITTLPTAGNLKLNGNALSAGQVVPVADVTSGKLTFLPLSDATGTPYATFTFQVQDNGGAANNGADLDPTPNTFALNVANVNDSPVLADIEETALAYLENDPATSITATLTITDPDTATLAGATVQITDGYQNGQDVLSFVNTASITGTWDAASGTMTLTGSDTLANYQAALHEVKYQNTSANPSTAARTVTFLANDGQAANNLSAPVTRQITVQGDCNLDADGNNVADALTDGILILRYLFDPAGQWNYSDALGSGATRTTRAGIKSFLDEGRTTALDVDGNGTPDALTDGILILRYLFDPAGQWNYSDALGTGATRTTRAQIKAFLDRYNPGVTTTSAAATDDVSTNSVATANSLESTLPPAAPNEPPSDVPLESTLPPATPIFVGPLPRRDSTTVAERDALDTVLEQWAPKDAGEPDLPGSSLSDDAGVMLKQNLRLRFPHALWRPAGQTPWCDL